MDFNQAYILNSDIVYRLISGEVIILDLNSGDYFSLNKAGTEIFLAIVDKKPLSSILVALQDKYNFKDEKELKKDIAALAEELLQNKIFKKEAR